MAGALNYTVKVLFLWWRSAANIAFSFPVDEAWKALKNERDEFT